MNYALIVCVHAETGGIGKNNNLLFRLKYEMRYFRHTTLFTKNKDRLNAVLMGYNTWVSIPQKFKPLDKRINIIISNNHYDDVINDIKLYNYDDTYCFKTIPQAMAYLDLKENIETCFVIGGQSIYDYFIKHDLLKEYYITKIMNSLEYDCDVFLPKINYDKLQQTDKNDVISEKDCRELHTNNRKEVFYRFCVYKTI